MGQVGVHNIGYQVVQTLVSKLVSRIAEQTVHDNVSGISDARSTCSDSPLC